ncbi:MAG TPA: hypothetical protein VK400_11070 [Pyrinomonadaceae bacterium]|nr:hypothetical protein [Pyrinomonadaceae bacterium]
MNQQFYKQNFNRMSYGELRHYSPNILAFPGLCAMKLCGLLPTAPTFSPMPTKIAFVEFERLSARCREFISPAMASFQRLGFEILGFEIDPSCENPNYIDGGGCHLVHPTRNFIALVSYHNFVEMPGMPGEFSGLTVWAQFENNSSLGLVNHRFTNYFNDKVLNRRTFYREASSPFKMLPVFEKLLEKFGDDRGAPAAIRTIKDLGSLLEKQSRQVLEAGLKSGRFVPMSELETIKMKQERIDKMSVLSDRFQDSATVRL